MIRASISCIPITPLLVGSPISASAADLTVAEQAAKLKASRKIKVELISGEVLKGRMGLVTADRFTLESGGAVPMVVRVVRYDEARSVKPDGLTRGEKWAIFGIVWVVAGVVGKLTT